VELSPQVGQLARCMTVARGVEKGEKVSVSGDVSVAAELKDG
jgi:hypothetical protein